MWTPLTAWVQLFPSTKKTTSKTPVLQWDGNRDQWLPALALCACRDALLYQWAWSDYSFFGWANCRSSLRITRAPTPANSSPIIRKKKGQHKNIIEKVQKDGYVRVRVDGEIYDVTEVPELSKSKQHTIEVVVDRIVIKGHPLAALWFDWSSSSDCGWLCGDWYHGWQGATLFWALCLSSLWLYRFPELEPRLFSFNAPFGSCPDCDGLGIKLEVDLDLVVQMIA